MHSQCFACIFMRNEASVRQRTECNRDNELNVTETKNWMQHTIKMIFFETILVHAMLVNGNLFLACITNTHAYIYANNLSRTSEPNRGLSKCKYVIMVMFKRVIVYGRVCACHCCSVWASRLWLCLNTLDVATCMLVIVVMFECSVFSRMSAKLWPRVSLWLWKLWPRVSLWLWSRVRMWLWSCGMVTCERLSAYARIYIHVHVARDYSTNIHTYIHTYCTLTSSTHVFAYSRIYM
jgi:hypothetical protein